MQKATLIILSILVIIVILVTAVSFIAQAIFSRKVSKEVQELFKGVQNNKEIITKEDLAELPACVQRWLEYSQVVGKERIVAARSKQSAVMRTEQTKPWMTTEADQYFTVQEPGFIWKAKIKAAPLVHIAGRDMYYEGRGNMLIKVLSLVTVADARGAEMDQGTMLRYLAETVWIPTAALSEYIQWEEIDANSARATMSYKGVTASGVFVFNDRGEAVNFVAERYMDVKGKYVLETWSITMSDHKEFSGIKIPSKGQVTWKLKTGDFNWFNFEVKAMEYNKPFEWKIGDGS